jgi:hypothetical protein
MKTLASLCFLLTLGAGLAGLARADTVPAESPTKVEGRCTEKGGTYFPKTGPDSTYGCVQKGADGDMTGIVCGGATSQQKKTCSTFRTMPPRLPTRLEVDLADKLAGARKAPPKK